MFDGRTILNHAELRRIGKPVPKKFESDLSVSSVGSRSGSGGGGAS
jgi:hypothetical protein